VNTPETASGSCVDLECAETKREWRRKHAVQSYPSFIPRLGTKHIKEEMTEVTDTRGERSIDEQKVEVK